MPRKKPPSVVVTARADKKSKRDLKTLTEDPNVNPVSLPVPVRILIRASKTFLATLLFNLTAVGIASAVPGDNPIDAFDVGTRFVGAIALSFGPVLYSVVLNTYLFVNKLDETAPEWMA